MDKKLILNTLQNHFNFKKDADFAEFLGISGQLLSKWKSRSTFDVDILYTKCTGINPEYLLSGKEPILKIPEKILEVTPIDINRKTVDAIHSEQFIPLYNLEATAGLVELFRNPNDAEPIDQIYIPNLPKCDGGTFVTGDSMYPLLKSGDIVVFKKISDFRNEVFYGEMYLLSMLIAGEEYISVKFVQKSDKGDDYIKLVSQNQHHQSKDIHIKKVMAMALIKASIRINSMS